MDWLIEQDVDVINASWSVGWDGPGDGTSPSASSLLRAVDKAVENGIVVTIAAGNYGRTSWFGTFNDPDDDNVLDFVDGDECNFMHGTFSGSGATVEVRWEDDWPGPETDLDIYVRKVSDGTIMAQGEDFQTGQSYQEPIEFISSYTAPEGTGALCLSIEHQSGDAPDWVQMIDIRSLGLERRTLSHGLRNPAETVNTGALTVGQAAYDDTSTILFWQRPWPAAQRHDQTRYRGGIRSVFECVSLFSFGYKLCRSAHCRPGGAREAALSHLHP